MSLRARWVLPIDAPPIENGFVRIDGRRIAEVGRATPSRTDRAEDLGDAILLPGLINAHAHLELSCYAGLLPPGPLWDWLAGLIALRRQPGAAARERQAIVDGANESLRAGVTCVADISRGGDTAAALAGHPIRKVCFVELISGASTPPSDPDELRERLDRARRAADERTLVGVSPHSFYNVSWDDLRRMAALAAEEDLPVTMHVAETRDELDWLESGSGAVAGFLARFGKPGAGGGVRGAPSELLHRCGLSRLRPLLAHVNYVSDVEIEALARMRCPVVFCPRAHAFFGHAPHRWRDLLASGVNVCLGTDGLASNRSLSMLDEIRALYVSAAAHSRWPPLDKGGVESSSSTRPDSDPAAATADALAPLLFEMATRRAAAALGLSDVCGTLTPGKAADLIAASPPRPAADPWSALLDPNCRVRDVWIDGRRVVGTRRSDGWVDG